MIILQRSKSASDLETIVLIVAWVCELDDLRLKLLDEEVPLDANTRYSTMNLNLVGH